MKWLVGILIALLIIIIAPFALMMILGFVFGLGGGLGFMDRDMEVQRQALVKLVQDANLPEDQRQQIEQIAEDAGEGGDGFPASGFATRTALEESGVYQYLALKVLHDQHIAAELDDPDLVDEHERQVERLGTALLEYGLDHELAGAYLTLYFRDPHDGYISWSDEAYWYPKRRPREPVTAESVEQMIVQLQRLNGLATVPQDARGPNVAEALQEVMDRASTR